MMDIRHQLVADDEKTILKVLQHILLLPKRQMITEQSLLRLRRLAANRDVQLEIYAQNPELGQNKQPRSMLKAALHSDS